MKVAANTRHTSVMEETRHPATGSRDGGKFPAVGFRPHIPLLAKAGVGARAISVSMVLTYAFASCAAVGFAAAAMLRHRAYHSAANDLAFFDQIIWNTAHGRFFATSFVPYNFLGQHVQPVLLIYALLYHLWASPELLLVTESVVVAAAAIPLFHLARRLLRHDGVACLVAGLYLLSPYLHQAVGFDFHPETMAPFFVFLSYGFVLSGKRRAAIFAALPLLLLKEDTVLLVLGIAWLCLLRRERRVAAILAAIAVGWGGLTTLVIMPHFRAGPSDLEDRYGYLGSGAANILIGLVVHPQRALAHLLALSTLVTLLALIGSVGLLPLAAPRELLAALPVLAFHLLSTHAAQNSLRLHYSAEVLPLISIAATAGLGRLALSSASSERLKRERSPSRRARWPVMNRVAHGVAPPLRGSRRGGIVLFTLCALIAFFVASPFPPARGFDSGRFTIDRAHQRAIAAAIVMIPADASVSAQTGLAPHLAHRLALSEFPDGTGAEYVLLDGRSDIAHPLRSVYPAAVDALAREGYQPLWSQHGVTLYRKM